MGHPYDVERASELHIAWCQALMERAQLETSHQAGPQLRAVMLELRDTLDPDAVMAVANALPALERGIFLEGWDPHHEPLPVPDAAGFADRVYERIKGHHARVPSLVGDVFWVLAKMLDPARAEAIRRVLPPVLAPLWPRE